MNLIDSRVINSYDKKVVKISKLTNTIYATEVEVNVFSIVA